MAEPGRKIASEETRTREIDGARVTETIIHWSQTSAISVDYSVGGVDLWADRNDRTSFDEPLNNCELRELLLEYGVLPPPGVLTRDAPGPSALIDLSRWRATFAEGYTEEDIDRVLGELARLGVHARCVWAHVDEYGPGGDSTLVGIAKDGSVRELPEGLLTLLVEGTGDGLIDPHAIPPNPRDTDLQAASAWRSARGFSRALDDRRP